jgi:hypothetical protein
MLPQISPLANVNGVSSPTQSIMPVASVLAGGVEKPSVPVRRRWAPTMAPTVGGRAT